MAISFWPMAMSRVGLHVALVPALAVWAFYALWLGLASTRLKFFAYAGILWALGLATHGSFWTLSLALILTLLAYWHSIKLDFMREQYREVRVKLTQGLVIFFFILLIAAFPVYASYYAQGEQLLEQLWHRSAFSGDNIVVILLTSFIKALGAVFVQGDQSWAYGFAGAPLLVWPVGILAAIGSLRSIGKLIKTRERHGHFSSVQALVLSWFFFTLCYAAYIRPDMPYAVSLLAAITPIFLFAGEGLWWTFEFFQRWHGARDAHTVSMPGHAGVKGLTLRESSVVAATVIAVFLVSLAIYERGRYGAWGENSAVLDVFQHKTATAAYQALALPQKDKKYIVLAPGGPVVDGLPISAQVVMYLTDTATPEKQKSRNIFYITGDEVNRGRYDRQATLIRLDQ